MKYLFVAVMFLACNKNLKIQGGDKQNIFLDHISDWAVHESGGTWRADNDYPKWIFGSDKVTKITFPDGYHTLPANDTLPGVCKHIYVATHQDSVEYFCKINGHPMMQHLDPDFLGGMGYQGPVEGAHSAKHDEKNRAEGIALVCVKCFHQTRQKIHYKHKE